MIHTLENQHLAVSVKQTGMELCSLKSKQSGLEYLWDGNPTVWASQSPMLFPVIGQTQSGGYQYQGRRFTPPRHGLVRNNRNISVASSAHQLSFTLQSDQTTLALYPFSFRFVVTFSLQQNRLVIEHRVENIGAKEMLFSLGGHPAFKCPLHANENYNDYYLEFEQPEHSPAWLLTDSGEVSTTPIPLLANTQQLDLSPQLFEQDALIFNDLRSERISLKSRRSAQQVVVRYAGFPYLALWAKPHADFICIEPWQGIADREGASDSFSAKEGLMTLAAGETHLASYSIEIVE